MTPGTTDIPIFRGARWSFRFRLEDEATGDPIDLTGTGPFVCEVKKATSDDILAIATVTSDYDDEGWFEITLEAAQTITFPLGPVRMGVRDNDVNPFLEWTPEVKWFTPTPH